MVEELQKLKYECLDVTNAETRNDFHPPQKQEDAFHRILLEIQSKGIEELEQMNSLLSCPSPWFFYFYL